ncbi:MAG: glycosyltransferase family 4 protein [Acidimicrobiales bacterium]
MISPHQHTTVMPAQPGALPAPVSAYPPEADGLRIALLVYRGNPHCGGQGVYVRHLSRELVALGHSVEVFSGQPWPVLDHGVGFTPVPSLDLYREPDPFRTPKFSELKSLTDLLEVSTMWTAGFPEPRTFSIRARKLLKERAGKFDVIHDNQSLGTGLLGMLADGWPLLTTFHHPITVDRKLAIEHAENRWTKLSTRRWYGFLHMQARVARRLPRIVTVSESSRSDISSSMGVSLDRMRVVPVGVDHQVFRPISDVRRISGRIMATSSSDVPMKGIVPLLEAVARIKTERDVELVIIGKPKEGGLVARAIKRLGLSGVIRCVSGVSDGALARLYSEAEVAVVPSLYEGFSLPAIEAMACGIPLVATTGGALPEVVGRHEETGLLVRPNSPGELASAITRILDDPNLARRLGESGHKRVLEKFTWQKTAQLTVEQYKEVIEMRQFSRSAGNMNTALASAPTSDNSSSLRDISGICHQSRTSSEAISDALVAESLSTAAPLDTTTADLDTTGC